VEKLSAI